MGTYSYSRLICVLFSSGFAAGWNEEMELFQYLFNNTNRSYSPRARPVMDKSKPVLVRMNIALAQVVELVSFDPAAYIHVFFRKQPYF